MAEHLSRRMSRIIRRNLKLNGYRPLVGHLLAPTLKKIRRTIEKKPLRWHATNGHDNIRFTDEDCFTVEEKCDKQNDAIYARTSAEAMEKESKEVTAQLHKHCGGVAPGFDVPPVL